MMKKDNATIFDNFTVDHAIKIQYQHLAEWKTVLKPKAYKALEDWATETNNTVTRPDSIRRGTDLDNFVANYRKIK